MSGLRLASLFCVLIPLGWSQAGSPWRAGEPLPGLSEQELDRFSFGRQQYLRQFSAGEGLGPTINNTSCALCHANPVGGWGEQRVTRFGQVDDQGEFTPTDPLGDTLWQHVAATGGDDCREVIPPEANHFTLRLTTGSTGYGLIEAITEKDILAIRDAQDESIRGIARWVQSREDPPDAAPRLGRFGWKAQEATILAFSADAASAEMGITTWLVESEPPPNGDWDLLADCDEVPDPETGVEVEGFDYLGAVTDFQRFMSPPPRIPATGMLGEVIFEQVGCSQCHAPQFTTPDDATLEAALRGQVIEPYSDFLLHDMGAAGDGVQDGPVEEQWMRTPPLWGQAIQRNLWHDGRCSQAAIEDRLRCAIAAHGEPGSQGLASVAAFDALSSGDQGLLLSFLSSLGRRPFDVDRDASVGVADLVQVPGGFLDCLESSPGPDDPCAVHDHDGDGLVGLLDLEALPLAWDDLVVDCNGNGQWDVRDIALGLSQDVDGNGIPDDCMTCLGDIDQDADVDVDDLLALISIEWGCSGLCWGDLDESGEVDSLDVLFLLALWGPCT
ncbi:MAG: hypothetical protein MK116_13675 [Phycisphaerales bacterium]|nr:hypothetical protein [Phycisphaerales bacterium]